MYPLHCNLRDTEGTQNWYKKLLFWGKSNPLTEKELKFCEYLYWIRCHQMRSFELKIHQVIFSRGSVLDPAGGAYDAPTDPLVG